MAARKMTGMDALRRIFGRQPKEHLVEIHDVRPDPARPEKFEPYFAAICSCGWVDASLDSEGAARTSASKHNPNVSAELRRPVG